MVKMLFDGHYGLRIDIDTITGYIYGVPRLLSLFQELNIRTTFALTTGAERIALNILGFFPPLANRMGIKRQINSTFSYPHLKEYLSTILLNKRSFFRSFFPNYAFIEAEKRFQIANLIKRQKHQLILHGHDHFNWANRLDDLPLDRQVNLLIQGIREFQSMATDQPRGFAAPAFRINSHILRYLPSLGFKFGSNFRLGEVNEPFYPSLSSYRGCLEIPVFRHPLTYIHRIIMDRSRSLEKNLLTPLKQYSNNKAVIFFLHAGVEGLYPRKEQLNLLNTIESGFTGSAITMEDYTKIIDEEKDKIPILSFKSIKRF